MSATKPFFIPSKEINLIDSMNEELIDEVLGQYVDIYKVDVENTDAIEEITSVENSFDSSSIRFDSGLKTFDLNF